jgi:hypothetical protein
MCIIHYFLWAIKSWGIETKAVSFKESLGSGAGRQPARCVGLPEYPLNRVVSGTAAGFQPLLDASIDLGVCDKESYRERFSGTIFKNGCALVVMWVRSHLAFLRPHEIADFNRQPETQSGVHAAHHTGALEGSSNRFIRLRVVDAPRNLIVGLVPDGCLSGK